MDGNKWNYANKIMSRHALQNPYLRYRRQALEEPQASGNPVIEAEEEKSPYSLQGLPQLATDIAGARGRQQAQAGVQSPFQTTPTETERIWGQPVQMPQALGGGAPPLDQLVMALGTAGGAIGGEDFWGGRLGAGVANLAGTMWQQRMREQSPEMQMARAKLNAFRQLSPEWQMYAAGVPAEALSPEFQKGIVDYTSAVETAKKSADPKYWSEKIQSDMALMMVQDPTQFQILKEHYYSTPDYLLSGPQLERKMAIKSLEAEAGETSALRGQREAVTEAMESLVGHRKVMEGISERNLQRQELEFKERQKQDAMKDPLGSDYNSVIESYVKNLDDWNPINRENTLNSLATEAITKSDSIFSRNPNSSYAASMLQSAFSHNMKELTNENQLPETKSKFVMNMDDVLWKKYQQLDWAVSKYNETRSPEHYEVADRLRNEYNAMRRSAEETARSLYGQTWGEVRKQAKAGKTLTMKKEQKGLWEGLSGGFGGAINPFNYAIDTIGDLFGGE